MLLLRALPPKPTSRRASMLLPPALLNKATNSILLQEALHSKTTNSSPILPRSPSILSSRRRTERTLSLLKMTSRTSKTHSRFKSPSSMMFGLDCWYVVILPISLRRIKANKRVAYSNIPGFCRGFWPHSVSVFALPQVQWRRHIWLFQRFCARYQHHHLVRLCPLHRFCRLLGLFPSGARLHKTIRLAYWNLELRLRCWDGGLLPLSSPMGSWHRLRHFRSLLHLLFHQLDSAYSICGGYASTGHGYR